jgi:hypothetical protein
VEVCATYAQDRRWNTICPWESLIRAESELHKVHSLHGQLWLTDSVWALLLFIPCACPLHREQQSASPAYPEINHLWWRYSRMSLKCQYTKHTEKEARKLLTCRKNTIELMRAEYILNPSSLTSKLWALGTMNMAKDFPITINNQKGTKVCTQKYKCSCMYIIRHKKFNPYDVPLHSGGSTLCCCLYLGLHQYFPSFLVFSISAGWFNLRRVTHTKADKTF